MQTVRECIVENWRTIKPTPSQSSLYYHDASATLNSISNKIILAARVNHFHHSLLGGSSPQEEGAAWLSQPSRSCLFARVWLFWALFPASDPEPPGLVPPSYFQEPSAREDGSTGSPRKAHLSQCRGLLTPLPWAKPLWLQGCDRNQMRVSPRSSPQGW